MTFGDLLNALIGEAGRYEFVYYIFGGSFALIVFELITTFIFGSILSFFKRR